MTLKLHARSIAVVMSSIAVLLALQSVYAEYVLVNYLGLEADTAPARLLDLFSVNLEQSLPTWYSTINLLLASGLLAWIALRKRQQQETGSAYWVGLSLLFLYFSIDEGASVHEATSGPLQSAFETSGFLEFGWLILGVPLVLIFAVAYFRFWLKLPPQTRLLFAVAAALYVGGAVLIESISANQYALEGGSSFLYLAIATVEELCEMLGVIVLIYALLEYLRQGDETLTLQPLDTQEKLRHWTSIGRTSLVFAAVLLLIDGGLLVWGLTLHDPSAAAAAPSAYAVVVEAVAADGISITQFSGVFSPVDQGTRRTAAVLQAGYPAVQILSLPELDASIAIAGDEPVLTQDSVVELMASMDETHYIFYDSTVVQAILSLP